MVESPKTYLPKQCVAFSIQSLPIDEASVAEVANLPQIHRDPFDRILIAQAIRHNLLLVTDDATIRAYPNVPIL